MSLWQLVANIVGRRKKKTMEREKKGPGGGGGGGGRETCGGLFRFGFVYFIETGQENI